MLFEVKFELIIIHSTDVWNIFLITWCSLCYVLVLVRMCLQTSILSQWYIKEKQPFCYNGCRMFEREETWQCFYFIVIKSYLTSCQLFIWKQPGQILQILFLIRYNKNSNFRFVSLKKEDLALNQFFFQISCTL